MSLLHSLAMRAGRAVWAFFCAGSPFERAMFVLGALIAILLIIGLAHLDGELAELYP